MNRFRAWDSLLRPLALAAALAGAASSAPAADAPMPTQPAPGSAAPAGAVYDGLPVGFTDEGHPYRGDPKAPVTLIEYSDYLCPFCARHAQQTVPTLIEQYVRTGKLRYVFRDFPVAELHPSAAKGAAAARCVGEQGPELFWKMHDELFRRQSEWNRLADPSEFLAGIAAESGADKAAYAACVASGRALAGVEKSADQAKALNFTGTPSFQFAVTRSDKAYTLVGAQPVSVFTQWVDSLVAGGAPPGRKKGELPFWARPEGLAPDPERPGFTKAGDPYKGEPKAPLAVIEFTDFQCPFCKRHALEIQPTLDKEFVGTGKVFWVLKNLPLRIHRNALLAATAAECAGEQGKFWSMYNRLFETQDQWSRGDSDLALPQLADSVGIDRIAFDRCFNGRKALQRVIGDTYDAQEGSVSSTPAFLLISGGEGAISRGSKSLDQFAALIRKRSEGATGESGEPQAGPGVKP